MRRYESSLKFRFVREPVLVELPTHRTGRIFERLKIRAFSCPVHTEPTLSFENSRLAVLSPEVSDQIFTFLTGRKFVRCCVLTVFFFRWVRITASGRKKDGTPSMQKTHQKAILFQSGVDLRHTK